MAGACLNPLHCGAVVASREDRRVVGLRRRVSIPFIAGQWSLLDVDRRAVGHAARLNPLHCGAVVASRRSHDQYQRSAHVSIPFIAGQWSLRGPGAAQRAGPHWVSIPFIAGQWSLRSPPAAWRRGREDVSQSPSLRGSGRFHDRRMAGVAGGGRSQSPSLRGSGRFYPLEDITPRHTLCLNPLHCGAVVASTDHVKPSATVRKVSIPFIAGQWSLPRGG